LKDNEYKVAYVNQSHDLAVISLCDYFCPAVSSWVLECKQFTFQFDEGKV